MDIQRMLARADTSIVELKEGLAHRETEIGTIDQQLRDMHAREGVPDFQFISGLHSRRQYYGDDVERLRERIRQQRARIATDRPRWDRAEQAWTGDRVKAIARVADAADALIRQVVHAQDVTREATALLPRQQSALQSVYRGDTIATVLIEYLSATLGVGKGLRPWNSLVSALRNEPLQVLSVRETDPDARASDHPDDSTPPPMAA